MPNSNVPARDGKLSKLPVERDQHINVVGLGYVGLPLATYLARVGYHVTGYDHCPGRVGELLRGGDSTNSVTAGGLGQKELSFVSVEKK